MTSVPGVAIHPAFVMVLSGLDKVPGFESLPVVETYNEPARATLVIMKNAALPEITTAAADCVGLDSIFVERQSFIILTSLQ